MDLVQHEAWITSSCHAMLHLCQLGIHGKISYHFYADMEKCSSYNYCLQQSGPSGREWTLVELVVEYRSSKGNKTRFGDFEVTWLLVSFNFGTRRPSETR